MTASFEHLSLKGSFKHLSLVAVIPITAHAHWHLATQLGSPRWLAPLLPVAIDSYVLAAFRAWRDQANQAPCRVKAADLWWALGLDAVAVAGSHAAGQFALSTPGMLGVRAGLAALLGVFLVLTLWRVHALDVRLSPQVKVGSRVRPVRGQGQVDVTPPVAPTVDHDPARSDPAGDPVGTGRGSTLVDVSGPVTLDRWVGRQFTAGAQRAEVIRVGSSRFGVSESTVKRRWVAEQQNGGVREHLAQ